MFHEGQMLTSIGDGSNGIRLGTHGKILALASSNAGHVQWFTGTRGASVTFERELDEVAAPATKRVQAAMVDPDGWEDSLEVGPVSKTGAAHLMATGGVASVIQQLASVGAFADTTDVGEEALAFAEARLRHSASLQAYLAELDEEDRNLIYRVASRDLLTQACGGTDD
jgi:hypothetical protein